MATDDYIDDLVNPEEQGESTIAKGIGQAATTLGMFMGIHMAAMFIVTKGKMRAFSALQKSTIPRIRAAATRAATTTHSLTDFIATVGQGKGTVSRLAQSVYASSTSKTAETLRAGWKDISAYEKIGKFRELSRANKTTIVERSVGKYLREAAVFMPSFYIAEHNIGILHDGPEKEAKPAWYNLPGHAIGFAKFVPHMLAIDLGFRGVLHGAKIAASPLRGMLDPLEHSIANSPIADAAVDAYKWAERGAYREKQIAGMKIGDIIDHMGVAKDAFVKSLKSPTRTKMWRRDKEVFSGYERTTNSLYKVYTHHRQHIKVLRSQLYTKKLERYDKRIQKAGLTTEESFRHNFSDFVKFMDEPGISGRTDYQEALYKSNRAASGNELLGKQYYNENAKTPFIARILGLKRAKASDYKAGEKTLGKIYDTASKDKWNEGTDTILGKRKKDFVSKLLSNNTFIQERSGQSVNLDYLDPRYWATKGLNSFPTILGYGVIDLFPFKVMTRRPGDRVMLASGQVPLTPSQQTDAFGRKLFQKESRAGELHVTYKNVYNFSSEFNDGSRGLIMRRAGDKHYSLWDFQGSQGANVADGWVQVGKNIKLALRSDSPKGQRVHYEGLVSATDKNTRMPGEFSSNPFMRFMQEKLSLLDNKGSFPSIFRNLQMVMPEGMQNFFNVSDAVRGSRSRKILEDLKKLSQHKVDDIVQSSHKQMQMLDIVNRTKALSERVRRRSFDSTLSDDYFFNDIIKFLDTNMPGDFLKGKKIRSVDDIFDLASHIRRNVGESNLNMSERELLRVDALLNEARLSKDVLRREVHPELPVEKLKRFIYDYSVNFSRTNNLGKHGIEERMLNKAIKAFENQRITKQQLTDLEVSIFSTDFREVIRDTDFSKGRLLEKIGKDDVSKVIDSIKKGLVNKFSGAADGRSVIDTALANTGMFETAYSKAIDTGIPDLIDTLQLTMDSNPWVAYPTGFKEVLGLGLRWGISTVDKLVSSFGLGWDKGRFSTPGEVIGLQGRRLATFSAALLGYSAVDSVTDASGAFDGTFLDEGLTVGLADQAVRLRMLAAKTYDVLGVDNAARYMEGLMPGSMNVLPGLAIGGLAGGMVGSGIPGAIVGAMVNAYLGPQLKEGPLSFLSIAPPLAPFVSDLTKSYDEVQDIYEGKELLARRKGAGWTLGQTPIEGGRIEGWELHWYPKLKSQYKATPVLYGSKVEQFLAKDVPLLDFSIMDIIDPQYLTYKHYENRPYLIPDTPFTEVPIIGPVLGATLGRAYNLVHPLGQVDPMHVQEAASAFMKGNSYDWKGGAQDTFGPQYRGLGPAGVGLADRQPGQPNIGNIVLSPYDIKPLLAESVYKGWIEWMGLPGFITSAVAWGGDEPFTNVPIAPAATDMDSFARSYWDSNAGDMALTNELFRRFVPRPRTSYETVDLIHNAMPGWIPEHLRTGDPYCLLPDTLVETTNGLTRSEDITDGMLVKTMYGRFYPVSNTVSRPVEEEIYCITLPGLKDFELKVTGEHPFYIKQGDEYKWVLAKNLTTEHRVTYPLLQIQLNNIIDTNIEIDVEAKMAKLLGLLARWTKWGSTLEYRDEIPDNITKEIDSLVKLLSIDLELIKTIVYEHQSDGMAVPLVTSDLAIVLNYLEPFRVKSSTNEIKYRFHSQKAAYNTWTGLLQNKIFSFINNDTLTIRNQFAAEIAYLLDIDIKVTEFEKPYCSFSLVDSKVGPLAILSIENIRKEYYEGNVHTIEVSDDVTYCLPGAIVHNSKITHGELYLPGEGYEAAFNPDLTFPVGMSRLGRSAYDQALGMIGLSNIAEDQEEILEKGTAIHKMVQNQLMMMGATTRIEALVTDPSANLRSYVDVMLKDPRGNEMPLEIKSISAKGFERLDRPKYSHKIQLNSYLAVMGVNRGKFLYVSREDPTKTKQFSLQFDPDMWEQTLGKLREARYLAQEFLSQGYGRAAEGYSYLDRARVLLNSAPYSKEYRETFSLLEEQKVSGHLSEQESAQLSNLEGYHKAMMRKYEMYPRRFTLDKLLDPDAEYQNLSSNEYIEPADTYSLAERIAGASWEYATHLRSPIHSKLFGRYSPEEQYDRFVMYGVPFQSWARPYDTFLKPYARGLRSVTDPLQGAMSFATGGLIFGGGPGALAGAAIGAAYGSMHGMYRAITGDTYRPQNFKDKVEMQEYFDTIEYMKAEQMYMATGNPDYRRQMVGTMRGWIETSGGQFMTVPNSGGIQGHYGYDPGSLFGTSSGPAARAARLMNNPYAQGIGTDQGFGSPWKGLANVYRRLFKSEKTIKIFRGVDKWHRGQMVQQGNFVGGGKYTQSSRAPASPMYIPKSETALYTSGSAKDAMSYGRRGRRPGAPEPTLLEFAVPETYVSKAAVQIKGRDFSHYVFDEGIPKRFLRRVYSPKTSPQSRALKKTQNPAAKSIGGDKGFGSPWQGTDDQEALNYDANINVFSGFSALAAWDRPFWTAFLETPEDKRDRILDQVDTRMGDMLKIAWGRGEEVAMPSMDVFFSNYKKPSALEPIMGPDTDISDYITVTANSSGLDAHDFGFGWRDQLRRIQDSANAILPINIHGKDTPAFEASAVSQGDISTALTKVLTRMGYEGARIQVNSMMSERDDTILKLNIRRDSSIDIIKALYG